MKWLLFAFFSGFSLGVSAQSEVFFNLPQAVKTTSGWGPQELILIQTGQLNELQYRETGNNNRVRVQQQGTQNRLDLDLSGNDNQYSIAQQGTQNRFQWGAVQQDGGLLEVLQRGNNNQLIREGNATAAGVPMRIEQTGGSQLSIRNGF
ncbi:hypothetical protein [Larkinella humicola]|uniref:Curlin n=1 Tax=Larkinella humicola TaxID=2607654 RepID=A0A5N1J3R1_9BACT|nr:hypothetical protein [Larkinella humicola]KAA9340396.1 hypothetical protein F0P93_31135 [Larkinella humicola]